MIVKGWFLYEKRLLWPCQKDVISVNLDLHLNNIHQVFYYIFIIKFHLMSGASGVFTSTQLCVRKENANKT